MPFLSLFSKNEFVQDNEFNHTSMSASVCNNVLHLGTKDFIIDCSTKCNNNFYQYHYVKLYENIIIDKQKLLPNNAYCIKSSINNCNTSTSNVILTDNHYECKPKYSLFGGENGNIIKGCKGMLNNVETNEKFVHKLPHNYIIDDLDRTYVNSNGIKEFVYVCGDVYNDLNNKLITPNLNNRFDLIENYCTKSTFNANFVLPDFEKFECNCNSKDTNLYNLNGNIHLECIQCKSGVGEAPKNLKGNKYGNAIIRMCKTNEYLNEVENFKIPCGLTTILENKSCETGTIYNSSLYHPIVINNF